MGASMRLVAPTEKTPGGSGRMLVVVLEAMSVWLQQEEQTPSIAHFF